MAGKIEKLQKRKQELEKAIEFTKQSKKKIIEITQKLVAELSSGRISRREYEEKLNQSLKNRSAEQWLKYYDDYLAYYNYQIKLCEKLIKQEKSELIKEKLKRKAVPALKILIIFILIALIISLIIILRVPVKEFAFGIGEKISTVLENLKTHEAEKAEISEAEKAKEVQKEAEFVEPKIEVSLQDKQAKISEESLVQYQAVVGKPVKWKKQFTTDSVTGFTIELPKGSGNISVKTLKDGEEEDITEIADINKKRNFLIFGEKAVEISVNKNSITENAVADSDSNKKHQYEIIYETPAPKAEEEILGENGKIKKITITGPDDVHYKNILSFTELPKELGKEEIGKLKLYQIKNNQREAVKFTSYDTDENNLIDYIEWLANSNEVYELVIEISKAEHLDENKNFISDIYEQIKALDNIWSEEIPDGHYVRVTFSRKLDNSRDITIYPRVVSGNPKIEVYEIDGIEKIAEFTSLNSNEYNKVFLTNLQNSQDVFDLRIVEGSIEIEHIIDPTFQYYLIGGSVTGNGGIGNLQTSTGNNKATWETSATGQSYTWIKKYTSATTLVAQTFIIGFWCNATATSTGNPKVEVDDFYVYDCGNSPTCATQDAAICNVTAQNIDCLYTAAAQFKTISCTSPSIMVLDTNDYLGVKLVADTNDRKTPRLRLYFNSSTFNSSFNITEETGDTTPPAVNLISPANNQKLSSTTINFNCSMSDAGGLKNSTLYGNWTGSWSANETQIISGTSNSTNFTKTISDGNYIWNCYVCDNATTSNCAFNNTNWTFKIDTLAPIITITSPLNKTYNTNTSISLNYSSSEALDTCWWTINNGATNNTPVGSEKVNNFNFTTSTGWVVGSYWNLPGDGTAYFYADNYNIHEGKIQQNITIEINKNYNVTYKIDYLDNMYGDDCQVRFTLGGINGTWRVVEDYEAGIYTYTETITTINTNNLTLEGYHDGTEIDSLCDIKIDYISVKELGCVNTTINVPQGSVNLFLYANDSAGNIGSNNVTFFTDSISPLLTISSPLNQTYNTNQILINFTADSYQNLWYYNKTDNRSYTSPETITAAEGSNTFIFYANDSAGNLNSSSRTFFVDSFYPLISFGSGTEISGAEKNQNWIYVDVTWTEDNFANITFSLYNDSEIVNSTTFTTPTYNINWTALAYTNYTYNVSIIDSANNFNSTDTRLIKLSSPNQAPQITYVSSIPDTIPLEGTFRPVIFNITVNDENGIDNINHTSIKANFTKNGEDIRQNQNCTEISGENTSTSQNYSCTIDMWYWDSAGDWNVSVYAEDLNKASGINDTISFKYNSLQAIVISSAEIIADIKIGEFNQTIGNLTINNTGNYKGEIKIKAINLHGEERSEEFINVSNFRVDNVSQSSSRCEGTQLINGTNATIIGSYLGAGNLSKGDGTAQEELYYCIKEVFSISSQTYSTQQAGSWTISLLAAAIIIKKSNRKKSKNKKKIAENDKLIQALNLLADELKQEYSLNKKEIIEIITEKLRLKYKINRKEIKELIKPEENIPIKIFSKKLGGLEAITKYMKENLNMNYKEISELLSRNERTIWTAYHKAREKQPEPIKIKETGEAGIFLPLSIFKNKKLTILESIILFLKSKQMKYSEIAELLSRDQRNIWTIYSRAKKK